MRHESPQPATDPCRDANRADLALRYQSVRRQTRTLAAPLSPEDCQAQSMPDASPAKWHLAHVTWFFETFVLEPFEPGFKPFNPAFRALYNSYYNGVGEQFARHRRGLVTRPDLAEVWRWHEQIDERVVRLISHTDSLDALRLIEMGLHHEQQHQELLLTDIKHLLSINPLSPVYQRAWPLVPVAPVPARWIEREGGLTEIGHHGEGFSFDNESPRHRQWMEPHALMNSGWTSCATAATPTHAGGSPPAGTGCARKAFVRRCTGRSPKTPTPCPPCSPCTATCRWIRTRRWCT